MAGGVFYHVIFFFFNAQADPLPAPGYNSLHVYGGGRAVKEESRN